MPEEEKNSCLLARCRSRRRRRERYWKRELVSIKCISKICSLPYRREEREWNKSFYRSLFRFCCYCCCWCCSYLLFIGAIYIYIVLVVVVVNCQCCQFVVVVLSFRVFSFLGGIQGLSLVFISVHCTRHAHYRLIFVFPALFFTRLHGYTSLVALLFVCICISFFTRPPKNWKSLAGTNFGRKTGDNATKMYRQTHNSNYEAQVWVNGCVAFKTFFCSRFKLIVLLWNALKKFKKSPRSSSKIRLDPVNNTF